MIYERIRFFIDNYIDPKTGKTVRSAFEPDRKGEIIDTQVSYALPIAMGIYEDEKFVNNFLNTVSRANTADDGTHCQPYSLMTGFIGTAWIMEALSKTGNRETAYAMLTNRSYPSWLYPVTQGATTVWERLNSYTHKDGFGKNNSMNSFNHYSFGSVGDWLLTRSLGINVGQDGSVVLRPEPDLSGRMNYAKGWLDTPRGRVESGWRIDSGKVVFEISLPEKTDAELVLPGIRYRLKSGENTITVPLTRLN